jgi:hypothetical protein
MLLRLIPAMLTLTFFAVVMLSAGILIGSRRAERSGSHGK